jgi:hypothetical protein
MMLAPCAAIVAVSGVVRMLRVSVRCAVRVVLAYAVVGDTRHVAEVPLCWVWCLSRVCACARGASEDCENMGNSAAVSCAHY